MLIEVAVIPMTLPFDCWEMGQLTWHLFFQTGFKEGKAALEAGGEPMVLAMQFYLKAFDIHPLSIWELFGYNVKQGGYKLKMSEWWNSTASITKTGRVIDGLIGPSHPSAGYPHDFPCWWGYTSVWNILDYPATTIPVKGFKISSVTDPKDSGHKPLDNNPFDKMYYDMCRSTMFNY